MMLSQQQISVLRLVWTYQPITDDGLGEKAKSQGMYHFSASGLRTRRSELVKKGLVESGGKQRKVRRGARAPNVWKTTEAGDRHIQAERTG